jgi:hypothetical protein
MRTGELYERTILSFQFPDRLSTEHLTMQFDKALFIAEKNIIDGATLDELKEAVRDLRALTPDSVLADLVETRVKLIESQRQYCCRCIG